MTGKIKSNDTDETGNFEGNAFAHYLFSRFFEDGKGANTMDETVCDWFLKQQESESDFSRCDDSDRSEILSFLSCSGSVLPLLDEMIKGYEKRLADLMSIKADFEKFMANTSNELICLEMSGHEFEKFISDMKNSETAPVDTPPVSMGCHEVYKDTLLGTLVVDSFDKGSDRVEVTMRKPSEGIYRLAEGLIGKNAA